MCSDETHLLSRDGWAHDVLVVTTTMGMVHGVHGNIMSMRPAVRWCKNLTTTSVVIATHLLCLALLAVTIAIVLYGLYGLFLPFWLFTNKSDFFYLFALLNCVVPCQEKSGKSKKSQKAQKSHKSSKSILLISWCRSIILLAIYCHCDHLWLFCDCQLTICMKLAWHDCYWYSCEPQGSGPGGRSIFNTSP